MKKSTGDLLKSLKSSRDYAEFLKKEIGELQFVTLSEYLDLLIESKKLKKSDIIVRSNLDKNYAYQIFNGTKTNPSRNKVLMLAFGMGLERLAMGEYKISDLRLIFENDERFLEQF